MPRNRGPGGLQFAKMAQLAPIADHESIEDNLEGVMDAEAEDDANALRLDEDDLEEEEGHRREAAACANQERLVCALCKCKHGVDLCPLAPEEDQQTTITVVNGKCHVDCILHLVLSGYFQWPDRISFALIGCDWKCNLRFAIRAIFWWHPIVGHSTLDILQLLYRSGMFFVFFHVPVREQSFRQIHVYIYIYIYLHQSCC